MARRLSPKEPRSANVTPGWMRAAIFKLRRRLEELQAIDVNALKERGEPRFDALKQKIDFTLVDIFGSGTIEHRRYSVMLGTASINTMYATLLNEIQEGYNRGIGRAISNLKTIIELFGESIGDMEEIPSGRALRVFEELDLHPEVDRAVSKLFNDWHYSNTVEDVCKILNSLVKLKSGKNEISGAELMQHVFSRNKPILKFNELKTETDKSE